MDCWFLVISLITSTVASNTSGTSTLLGPGQLTKTGPMSRERCVNTAKVLKAANPDWTVNCSTDIPGGGWQIQAF